MIWPRSTATLSIFCTSAGRAVPQLRQRVGDCPAQLPNRFVGENRSRASEPFYADIQDGKRLLQLRDLILKGWVFSCLDLPKGVPSVRTSALRFRRFANTSFGGRSTFDSTASVIVATTFSAKWSMRSIATSARIAATITMIDVALISASSNCPGRLHNREAIPLRSGSVTIASCRPRYRAFPFRTDIDHLEPNRELASDQCKTERQFGSFTRTQRKRQPAS